MNGFKRPADRSSLPQDALQAVITPATGQNSIQVSARLREGQRNDESEVQFRDKIDRMCRNKMRYPSKRDALTAKNFIKHHHGRAGNRGRSKQLRVYPCPHCGGWHLTKKV